MALSFRRRSLTRVAYIVGLAIVARLLVIYTSSSSSGQDDLEIREQNYLDKIRVAGVGGLTGAGGALDVQRHKFLQVRLGRDEREDMLDKEVRDGYLDFWQRYEMPYITSEETSQMDAQGVLRSIEQLLSLNGWVAALCPTLSRPFGQNKNSALSDSWDDLARSDRLYYIAIVIHSADHFLVDQLAVIVQLAKRLGTQNVFVSMLDYSSTDSTETLTDLCEAVLTLLGVPFRIRRVPGMTVDPAAAYYPAEEAHMRNLALEPLRELYQRRDVKFHRVIWLKGFTCPNDILETIKVSLANDAAMVCGMDWAEHNGFYIFSDRWRTRDIDGDQFRQSKSSSKPDAGPPRDKVGSERYAQHLPFQVFCCESGTHVVDPAQSYYEGISYRYGEDFFNATEAVLGGPPQRDPAAPCLDSSQAYFCRDLWVHQAQEGMRDVDAEIEAARRKDRSRNNGKKAKARRQVEQVDEELLMDGEPDAAPIEKKPFVKPEQKVGGVVGGGEGDTDEVREDAADLRKDKQAHEDANVGSDFDAMPETEDEDATEGEGDEDEWEEYQGKLSIPNNVFRPARILVNPRCVTTYAGVSHTQLALDLFGGPEEQDEGGLSRGKYVLEDWEGAPSSFVCQEQRSTGGRKATKTQRRLGFSIHEELEKASSIHEE
ncbi:glycosyltransferase family 69 protein [Punctularia strigosozonata HHB-11173 SS5]|uniref:Glycosyltransferase family 69 protein n=1 Tax=Punctularia strigosozonata (strain HHB-11173) TaxID=741275 RepID=R7S3N4_PUNST|nr:glycosyltransferase family 69 protein [Punctularia strigosozonata HHB-11173 SS5]EIN04474.1 glycosyltransferase family 69 protein [Punctularia strigosozonata HHB-11173 SS5]